MSEETNKEAWPFPTYTPSNQEPEELKDNYRTVHLFNKSSGYGGITIVYAPVLPDKNNVPTGDFAHVSVAICSHKDRYNRKLGEMLAYTNLLNGRFLTLPIYRDGHPVRMLKNMFGLLPLVLVAA